MDMMEWIDTSLLDDTLALLDEDFLQMFGVDPVFAQFVLVFLFVMTLMWVVRPVIEWMMVRNWNALSSYVTSALIALVFLQLVDRYAMVQDQSTLPSSYWSICLLAISSFGVSYTIVRAIRKTWVRLSKRSKKRAA